MLKNQKRRSDLNLRLSKQIMDSSEQSSPYKNEQIDNYDPQQQYYN